MNKKNFTKLLILIISVLLLTACVDSQTTQVDPTNEVVTKKATDTVANTETPTNTPAPTLSVEITNFNDNLQIIERNPNPGGAHHFFLPTFKFVFNQDMDREATASAWSMTDQNDLPIEGKIKWIGEAYLHLYPLIFYYHLTQHTMQNSHQMPSLPNGRLFARPAFI